MEIHVERPSRNDGDIAPVVGQRNADVLDDGQIAAARHPQLVIADREFERGASRGIDRNDETAADDLDHGGVDAPMRVVAHGMEGYGSRVALGTQTDVVGFVVAGRQSEKQRRNAQ